MPNNNSGEKKLLHDPHNERIATLFNKGTIFIDHHVQEFRLAIFGLATVGVIVIGRSIRMFTQFQHAKDIPGHFITKHAHLQGKVKDVSVCGKLMVQHIPILTIRWMKYFSKGQRTNLPIEMCGVRLTDTGLPWLKDHLLGKVIWFQMIAAGEDGGVKSIVTVKKNLLTTICVNEELIKQGLATAEDIEGTEDSKTICRLAARLSKAELYAEKKGLGIWKRPPVTERLMVQANAYKLGFVVSLKNFSKKIIDKFKYRKKIG